MYDEDVKFQWQKFGRDIVIFVLDLVILVVTVSVIVCVFYWIFRLWNFVTPKVFTVKDCIDILSAIAWPIFVLFILLLFRNPLMRIIYEAPGFIRRSRYGQGVFSRNEKEQAIEKDLNVKDTEDGSIKNENFEQNQRAENNGCVKENLKLTPALIEKSIIGKLKKEYAVSDIIRDVRIRQSNLIFDGAFWKNDCLYAVEIKRTSDFIVVRHYLERVAMFVQGLPKKYRENFSIVLCLVYERVSDDLRIKLEEEVQRLDFEVIIKHYLFSEIN